MPISNVPHDHALGDVLDLCLGCMAPMGVNPTLEVMCSPCQRILARMPENAIYQITPYGPEQVGTFEKAPLCFACQENLAGINKDDPCDTCKHLGHAKPTCCEGKCEGMDTSHKGKDGVRYLGYAEYR